MQCEALTQTKKAVVFSLDNTLFDHYHSLRCATSVIQNKYAILNGHQLGDLIDKFNIAFRAVHDDDLSRGVLPEDMHIVSVRSFFTELGLAEPSLNEVDEFLASYKPAYRSNRRATPGSVETLVRLRENGYLLAIVTSGQTEIQSAKAEVIGIRHLVDRIFTSEEAGHCEPDRLMFDYAVKALDTSPDMVHMVGASAETDIEGAFDAGLSAILYSPVTQESQRLIHGETLPVIHHMGQLLERLGMITPEFKPCLVSGPGQLIIKGLGIDLVTEPRHCLQISKEIVTFLARKMGQTLERISKKHYRTAMFYLEQMIKAIAKVAMPIDETKIMISYPGQDKETSSNTQTECSFEVRDHSIRAEYARLILVVDSGIEATLCESVILLQSHCNNLMRDYPRAAVRDLRSTMLLLADKAGIRDDTVIMGEDIEG